MCVLFLVPESRDGVYMSELICMILCVDYVSKGVNCFLFEPVFS